MVRRILVALASLSLILGMGLIEAPSSGAATICPSSASYTSVVDTYHRGSVAIPLRCGNSSFGYRHFSSRWNGEFDAMIALTIARGVADGPNVYDYYPVACEGPVFRVVYNLGAYNGNGVRPHGIITAYYITVNAAQPDGCEPI